MVVTLSGANDFMLRRELDGLLSNFVAEHGDLALERYDGEDLEPNQLPAILQAMPFLASRRLVLLRQPSVQKALQEQLEQQLTNVPDSTELIIVESRPDKRTSYYKALQKQTDFKSYDELNEQQLTTWLTEQAHQQGGQLSLADARYLVQRLGLNQMLLSNELQKLLSHDPKITRADINALTEPNPQSTVFELLDAAFSGQRQTVSRLYHEQRQQKVEPLAILAMITWQLHVFALIKTAAGRSPQAIANEAKISPYVLRKSLDAARRFDLTDLKAWIHRATELDVRLKSQAIDADDALLEFLLNLTTS